MRGVVGPGHTAYEEMLKHDVTRRSQYDATRGRHTAASNQQLQSNVVVEFQKVKPVFFQ